MTAVIRPKIVEERERVNEREREREKRKLKLFREAHSLMRGEREHAEERKRERESRNEREKTQRTGAFIRSAGALPSVSR